METGDLREWYYPCPTEAICPGGPGAGGGEFNSLNGDSVASQDHAHSGLWSAKMTISATTVNGKSSGTRLFRWNELAQNRELYYSVWYFVPRHYVANPYGWENWFQYKSETPDGKNDPFFIIGMRNLSPTMMSLGLTWWPDLTIEGPGPGQYGGRTWNSSIEVPVGRWFNVEVRHICAGDFTGAIQVWQDGVEIFHLEGIRTRYPNGDCVWSVNNYGTNILPSPVVIYVDDVIISKTRVGP